MGFCIVCLSKMLNVQPNSLIKEHIKKQKPPLKNNKENIYKTYVQIMLRIQYFLQDTDLEMSLYNYTIITSLRHATQDRNKLFELIYAHQIWVFFFYGPCVSKKQVCLLLLFSIITIIFIVDIECPSGRYMYDCHSDLH